MLRSRTLLACVPAVDDTAQISPLQKSPNTYQPFSAGMSEPRYT